MAFGRENSVSSDTDELMIFMGKGVEIKGDIEFEGSGRLDGKVEGKITVKGTLILGEGADIFSEIQSTSVIIGGKVQGKIVAHEKVQLLDTSAVNCDILTPSLIVEEGAQFNGSSKMGNTEEIQKTGPAVIAEKQLQNPIVKAVR